MTITTLKFQELAVRTPIIQGGMGVSISMGGLASAVANQGGIGVIATVMLGMGESDSKKNTAQANIRVLREEIKKAKAAQTDGLIAVNIMTILTNYEDTVKASIEEGIDIIFSGAGLPLDLPKYLVNGAKTKLVPIVSSGRAAALLCKKWVVKHNYLPDGFVVEGPMAGGHLGFKAEQIYDPKFDLEILFKDVVDAVKPFEEKHNKKLAIIPAGGIFDGADIAKYLKMGAAGVQMGTRFVATHECDSEMGFKQAYVDAKKEDITIITSPVGLPGRALKNQFIEDVRAGKLGVVKCPYHCIKTCNPKTTPYCIAMALGNGRRGSMRKGLIFVGENVHRVKKIVSVKELMTTLIEETKAHL